MRGEKSVFVSWFGFVLSLDRKIGIFYLRGSSTKGRWDWHRWNAPRLSHAASWKSEASATSAGMPPPLYSVIDWPVATPPLISPEFDQNQNQRGSIDEKSFGFVKTVKMSANVKMILISYGQDYEKLLHLRKRRRKKKKKKKKKKAWERREKRMQEISLLRSIPYSDHQRMQVQHHCDLICLHSSLVVFLTIYSCEIECLCSVSFLLLNLDLWLGICVDGGCWIRVW